MKNILFFCNTYYQIIVAVQMMLTVKKGDKGTVILTDQSAGAEQIAEKLRSTGIFENVFFLPAKVIPAQVTPAYKVKALARGVFGSLPKGMDKQQKFDELIGFNMDMATHDVFAGLYNMNPHIICNSMEEGLLSYETPWSDSGLMRMIWKVRHVLGKKNLRENIKKFYCFNPAVYKGSLEAVPIPKIEKSNAQLLAALDAVFLAGKSLEPYDRKYIFLSCVYDQEGGEPIGELDAAMQIAGLVGKENLLVKVHPRDNVSRFVEAGLTVDRNSSVPWEVICINKDFSRHVFITTLSGSVLNVGALLANAPLSYYCYPLCHMENNAKAQHFQKVIDNYVLNTPELGLEKVRILTNINQLTQQCQ